MSRWTSGPARPISDNGPAWFFPQRTVNQIFIPRGFAHGFLALTDSVEFLYKCDEFYDPRDEHGILWNDPDLNFSWGFASPIVSEKDARLLRLADVPLEFLPAYSTEMKPTIC